MAEKAFVFMAKGFEEMELTISVDILRRAGMDVKTVSLAEDLSPVTGSRGIKMLPDMLISDLKTEDADIVILPGGIEGTTNLGASDKVISLIREMNSEQKKVAAICAAPAVLVKAGILKGKKATSHPAAKDHMLGTNYQEDRVVVEENIITSRAAGTTFEFAFKIIEEFYGPEKVYEVNKGVLANL